MPATFPLVALVILDGWGIAPAGPGNAVELAATPVFDDLRDRFPSTTLAASGEAVGLPAGQMGNSEVGHLTIGAGRVVDQDLVRIDRSIESGTFFENHALTEAFDRAAARGGAVHLLGLVSKGGVHSQFAHLLALVELGRQRGLGERTFLHAFTDGRDVSPTAAAGDLRELIGHGVRIATVVGRYWAMDRDGRWGRTGRALRAIVDGEGLQIADPVAAVQAGYGRGETDEFIEALVVEDMPRLSHDDAAIFFNFRPDRARQLSQRLLESGYDLTTMTRYRDDFACPVAFEEQIVTGTLAEVIAGRGSDQLHIAETEKYAHVTYFLNGGREQEWPGETRILVPSPRDVATYDLKPAMSAPVVADRFVEAVRDGRYTLVVVNFANPDMVGHTGVIPAAVAAVEAVDDCLGRVAAAVHEREGVCLVFADHGNAEQLLAADGVSPHTAHTTNPVPLIVTSAGLSLRPGGGLADVAPTCLALLGIEQAPEMTGTVLTS
jgi:2,3-bisphosphoglycerate-independent phosphoglycerate mutase